MKKRLTLIALAAAALAAPLLSLAQDKWPSKTIEIIYPYPPGNDFDVVARALAASMSKRLGVQVQVINKPGGGGVVGFAEMVKAKPDGYTIGTWTPGPGITQILAGNTPYKSSDYVSLGSLIVNDFVLASRGDIPAKTQKEFGEWAKKQGKPIVIASYAPASLPALVATKLAKLDGYPVKVVAFPNPSAKELTAGDADLSTTGAEMVSSHAKAGQVKVLSAWLPKRSKFHPDVATLGEAGYPPIFLWSGMAAPAGIPPDILKRLETAIAEAAADKDFQAVLTKQDTISHYLSATQATALIASDTKWITELMTELGMLKK